MRIPSPLWEGQGEGAKQYMKQFPIPILILILSLTYIPTLEAAGLSTGFSEVTLEGLDIGKSYSTQETAHLPLIVVNTGEESLDLKIELLLPEAQELKEGFTPIPDLAWIKLEQSEFKEIAPNASATTDILINIPNDKQYQGKKYQAYIWSHSVGRTIGVGLKSKLLFTITRNKE